MTKASETQVGGDHYRSMGDFQPWDVLQHWLTPEEYRGYQKGVAIAYLARERQKGGIEDIAKAAHHLQKLVEVLGEQEPEADSIDERAANAQQQVDRPIGWVDHDGGVCPVQAGTMVRVRLRNGQISEGRALFDEGVCVGASQWIACGREDELTIAAYQILQQQLESTPCN